LRPETPEVIHLSFARPIEDWVLELESDGEILLRYAPSEIRPAAAPVEATEPPAPEEIATNDELYLTGLHLEQYRHATRSPEPYWREGLRRDPQDSRINNALGRLHLRRGKYAEAEQCLRTAVSRLTMRNPNPYDSEAYYNLGMTLLFQDRADDAYDSFYKATWSAAWRGPAYHRLAEIDLRNGRLAAALDHVTRSLRAEAENLNARNLRIAILRRQGSAKEADAELNAVSKLDPLDIWTNFSQNGGIPADAGKRLDLSFDLIHAGLVEEADRVLQAGTTAIELYTRSSVLTLHGQREAALDYATRASAASPTYVFPSLLEELKALEEAILVNPKDARAPYYLGNLLYDRRRHRDAIKQWEKAAELDPNFPTVWRNLGIAYFNVEHDPAKARKAFEQARKANPDDARILYEEDQLRKRLGDDPAGRLAILEARHELVARRDDMSVELAAIYNQVGRPADALSLLLSRQFQPWEGGEGLVLGEYVRAQLLLGRAALARSDASVAIERFEAADRPPQTLNEARHLLANSSNIEFWLGEAWAAKGELDNAKRHWERAVRQRGDFQQMQVRHVSEMTYWSALAMRRLRREEEATSLFKEILNYAANLEKSVPKIDYFATSLPTMLLFDEDLKSRQRITATFLKSQALLGLGFHAEAQIALAEVQRMDRGHAAACDLRTVSLVQQMGG
jgi:tetratricopeptide (TPR) repeat protein